MFVVGKSFAASSFVRRGARRKTSETHTWTNNTVRVRQNACDAQKRHRQRIRICVFVIKRRSTRYRINYNIVHLYRRQANGFTRYGFCNSVEFIIIGSRTVGYENSGFTSTFPRVTTFGGDCCNRRFRFVPPASITFVIVWWNHVRGAGERNAIYNGTVIILEHAVFVIAFRHDSGRKIRNHSTRCRRFLLILSYTAAWTRCRHRTPYRTRVNRRQQINTTHLRCAKRAVEIINTYSDHSEIGTSITENRYSKSKTKIRYVVTRARVRATPGFGRRASTKRRPPRDKNFFAASKFQKRITTKIIIINTD